VTNALAILAPVSGNLKPLTAAQPSVAPGDVLFEFEAAAHDADRQRLEIVAQSLAASMQAGAAGGELELVIRERSEIVEKHTAVEASLQRLLAHHEALLEGLEGHGELPADLMRVT